MPERADIETAINDAMPEMENRFMWAASTGNHPDATAEGAVRTILEPFLDRVRDARGDDECTCAPTTGTDYEPHDPGCPKARSTQDVRCICGRCGYGACVRPKGHTGSHSVHLEGTPFSVPQSSPYP